MDLKRKISIFVDCLMITGAIVFLGLTFFLLCSFLLNTINTHITLTIPFGHPSMSALTASAVAGATFVLAFWTKKMVTVQILPLVKARIKVEKYDPEQHSTNYERGVTLEVSNYGEGLALDTFISWELPFMDENVKHEREIGILEPGEKTEYFLHIDELENGKPIIVDDLLNLGYVQNEDELNYEINYSNILGASFFDKDNLNIPSPN